MFLSFLKKYELGLADVLSASQKHHVLPPQKVLEEPTLELKSYEKKRPLLCANFLKTIKNTSSQHRRCELSCSSPFYFFKDLTPQNLCEESRHVAKLHYLDI